MSRIFLHLVSLLILRWSRSFDALSVRPVYNTSFLSYFVIGWNFD